MLTLDEDEAVELDAVALAAPVGVETVEWMGAVLVSADGVVLSVRVDRGVVETRVTECGRREDVVAGKLSSSLEVDTPVPGST